MPVGRLARCPGNASFPGSRGCGERGMEPIAEFVSCPREGTGCYSRGTCGKAMKRPARGGEWLSRGGECMAKAMKRPARGREWLLAGGE